LVRDGLYQILDVENKMDIDLWTEKHRPQTLSEIVGQETVVKQLMKFVEMKAVPHCLFAGPPGTAKTTAGMAMARDLFGDTFDRNFMELNASDERGIDVVRNQIKNFARILPAGNAPFKLLILDEADHLTNDAQHALRRTMESYASSCRMILICNYSSRIIPPIQSRCAIFKFNRLDDQNIAGRLKYIADSEHTKIDESGLDAILYLAEGDMRAAINLMQAASSTGGKITEKTVYGISGRVNPGQITEMLQSALNGDFETASEFLNSTLKNEGISPIDLVRQIHRSLAKMELDDTIRMMFLERTAETEFRISEGASGEIQLVSLLSYMSRGMT
jgi:replication factor C small subunit